MRTELVSATARRLVAELPRLTPAIAAVAITTYEPAIGLDARLGSSGAPPSVFIDEALRHRGYVEPIIDIPSEALSAAMRQGPPPNRVRGICSRVRLRDGTRGNLPLLDFRCDVAEATADALLLAMEKLGQGRGALLVTGRSYHFLGFEPLPLEAWRGFMSRALLLAPLIDVRYVAHCLIEELACLRIDAHESRPMEPVVIRLLPDSA